MADHHLKNYWLIAVPRAKTGEDAYSELTRVTTQDKELCLTTYKFEIPDLRVGNMDSLVILSDDLKKVNGNVESTLKRIANQYFELQREGQAKDAKRPEIEVRGTNSETFLTRFRWDDSRYPRRKLMPELVSNIRVQVLKMEAELKMKSGEYQQVMQRITQLDQSQVGSLLTRDFTKEIKEKMTAEQLVETEFLTTLFVVVPRNEMKEWSRSYETLAPYVVPRSGFTVVDDNDYSLQRVVVFKRDVTDFSQAARQKRFTVRKLDPSTQMSEDEVKALHAKQAKLKKQLLRWTLTNFGEAFLAWIHLKCIQCFVEAIMRFGLPADFQAMLLLPKKGKEGSLEKALVELYRHLGRGDASGDDGNTVTEEETKNMALLGPQERFFPFVFLEIDLDLH
jgi:V-type H+-transporting ATPase subunit C